MITDQLVIVRGGGDIATGVVQALRHAGFPVLILETDRPSGRISRYISRRTWIRRSICSFRKA